MYPEFVASPVIATSCKGNGGDPAGRARDDADADAQPGHAALDAGPGRAPLGPLEPPRAERADLRHHRPGPLRRRTWPSSARPSTCASSASAAPPQPTPNVDEVLTHERLHDLLGRSDFVVVTAPRTPETTGMLGEAEFRAMKPTRLLHLLLPRRHRRRRGAAAGAAGGLDRRRRPGRPRRRAAAAGQPVLGAPPNTIDHAAQRRLDAVHPPARDRHLRGEPAALPRTGGRCST